MRAIVVGGTGTVGAGVVRHLRAHGAEAVAAARRAGEAGGVSVDVRDPAGLERAAAGFDAAFLITPLGPDEGAVGVAAVSALRAAGVGKIAFLSIHNLEAMRAIPHFEQKIPIKQAVLAAPTGVVLEANFFFQNDLMALPAIQQGFYPLPIGEAGVFSIDAADIAKAGARALLHDTWNGRAVPVCGAERLTGPGIAASWAQALGRPVRYGGDAIPPFIAAMAQVIPNMDDWIRNDFEVMMRVTQAHGCPATEDDIAAAAAIIGAPQTTHAAFAAQALAAAPE